MDKNETLRLLGVDTPETVHPNKQVEYFGIEASNFTKNLTLGHTVYLAFDYNLRDKYGRLLAYVFIKDYTCLNALIIQQGFGFAYIQFPFACKEEFVSYELEAKKQKTGLWAHEK